MADTQYNDTGAQVAPQVGVGDDYQHIDATPASFGGLIAKGLNEAGQGAVKAGQFFGQVAADNGTNDFQDYSNKLLYGDPSKTTIGPDGKPQQDLGYLGLKGRAALDARPAVEAQLDDKLKEIRGGLQTPEQQLQFDNYSKRYRARASEQIGSHADTQANTWYAAVNQSAGDLALAHIAQNADNPTELAAGIADLRSARVKTAQLAGGGPELVKEAIDSANRDGLKAQLEVISVHDPARAAAMLEKNKAIAGTDYEALAKQFKAASDHQTGTATADQIYKNSPRPDVQQDATNTGASGYGLVNQPYRAPLDQKGSGGVSASDHYTYLTSIGASKNEALMLTGAAGSESAFNPNAVHDNGNGYGLYGHNTQRLDLRGATWQDQAKQALAELRARPEGAAVNAATTPEQLAIAEMRYEQPQGFTSRNPAGGLNFMGRLNTIRYFSQMANGTMSGSQGAPVQGPSPTGPHGQSPIQTASYQAPSSPANAAMQEPVQNIAPVDTTSVVPPPPPDLEGQQAAADQHAANALLNMPPDLSAEAQAAYKSHVESLHAAETLGIKAQSEQQKVISNKVTEDYLGRIDKGDFASRTGGSSIFDDVKNDPRLAGLGLRGEIVKQTIMGIITRRTGNEDSGDMGSGYLKAMKGITAPYGDPNKIVDPIQILQMENSGELTKRGAMELQRELGAVKKEDGPGIVATKSAMLTYASSLLSFDQEMSYPGMPPLKDEKGREAFLSEFVPKFYAGYDNWVKQGKDPMQFLTRDNIAKMAEQVRPKKEMAMDKLIATNSAATIADNPATPLPEAPQNVQPDMWKTVVSSPPVRADNTHMPHEIWAKFVENLVKDPSQENINLFNSSQFGRAGYRAERIIKQLTGKDPQENLIPEERTEGVSAPVETPAPRIIGGHTTLHSVQ